MLFIIGHMRSGSTLLVHLLANHPEILGYGETHHLYNSIDDFGLISYSILRKFGRFIPKEKFYFDKVLHKEKQLSKELLDFSGTRVILLIRKPDRAIQSILQLGLLKTNTEERALQYYKGRLDTISDIASSLGSKRCFFITYDDLIENPTEQLQKLSSFLNLSTPLTEEYQPLWSTGRTGIGDTSDSIHSGKITPPEKPLENKVSENIILEAMESYQDCLNNCSSL